MQNLRDKLLKAGIVDKKQKKRAEQDARQERKQKGGHVVTQGAEARRQEIYEQKLSEQRERDRILEEKRRIAREAREQHLRIQYMVEYYGMTPRRGPRRWYFMARNRKIRFLEVNDDDARRLEKGLLAIVERIGDLEGAYTVVPAEVADHIWKVDDNYVRFYNRDISDRPLRWWEVTEGPLPTQAAVPVPEPTDAP